MSNKLPNIDRIREHQANERTFLAWLRTAIALIGFGFAISRFSIFLRQINAAFAQQETTVNPLINSENLGIFLVVFGIITIALAAWRYNQVFRQIEQGDYRPKRLPVLIMTGAVMVFGLLSIPLLLIRNQIPQRPVSTPKQNQSFRIR